MSESITSDKYRFSSSPCRLRLGKGVRLALGPPWRANFSKKSNAIRTPLLTTFRPELDETGANYGPRSAVYQAFASPPTLFVVNGVYHTYEPWFLFGLNQRVF